MVPSLERRTAFRAAGAPGLSDPSSFSLTALTMRIVAVACAVAETGRSGGEGLAKAAAVARRRIMDATANAFAAEW
jgi:hypothetical protein